MSDLVERLRSEAAGEDADPVYGRLGDLLREAATEIESLRGVNATLMKEAEEMVMAGYREAYDVMRGKAPMTRKMLEAVDGHR